MKNQKITVLEWVNHLNSKAVCDFRAPVVGDLTGILTHALKTKRIVNFVGISCQPWKEVGENLDEIPQVRLGAHRGRPERLVEEVAGFFQSLEAVGVRYQFHYSVSDIEVAMHMELGNMGLKIRNPDALENAKRNHEILTYGLKCAGVKVRPFSETKMLTDILDAKSLEDLQVKIAGKENPHHTEFVKGLVYHDLVSLLPVLCQDAPTVWLDVQSLGFKDLVVGFEKSVLEHAPQIPLVTAISNAGSWNYRGVSINTFLGGPPKKK